MSSQLFTHLCHPKCQITINRENAFIIAIVRDNSRKINPTLARSEKVPRALEANVPQMLYLAIYLRAERQF